MDMTPLVVKLDRETRARLQKLGKARNRSSHWLMLEAIRRYLEVEERYEQEKAEDQARYKRGPDSQYGSAGASTCLLGTQVPIQPGCFCLWNCGRWRWEAIVNQAGERPALV